MPSVIVISGGSRLEVEGLLGVGRRTYNQQVILDTPAAFWTLDEPSGTSFADSIGVLTGTLVDTGALTVGAPKVLKDDNQDERSIVIVDGGSPYSYIDILNSVGGGHIFTTLGSNGTDFAVECWLATTDTGTPVSWYTSNNAFEMRSEGGGNPNPRAVIFNVGESNGKLNFGSGTNLGTGNESVGLINDGNIHHCVVNVTAGTSYEMFIDGVSDSTGTPTASGTMAATIHPHNLVIGCRTQDNGNRASGWNGTIDACAIYTRRLTVQEITTHYNLGSDNLY